MDTGMNYIQAGWTVRSRDGQELGTVTSISHDAITVGGGDEPMTLPKSAIDEEDEGAELAILSIDADDIEATTLD